MTGPIGKASLKRWPLSWAWRGVGGGMCVCVCVCVYDVWLFVTPWTAAHQAPLFLGIFQARILEWVTMPSSRGSSQPRDGTRTFYISLASAGRFFPTSPTWEALLHGVEGLRAGLHVVGLPFLKCFQDSVFLPGAQWKEWILCLTKLESSVSWGSPD